MDNQVNSAIETSLKITPITFGDKNISETSLVSQNNAGVQLSEQGLEQQGVSINNDQVFTSDEQRSINDEQDSIAEEQHTINDEPKPIAEEQHSMKDEPSSIAEEQPTSDDRTTIAAALTQSVEAWSPEIDHQPLRVGDDDPSNLSAERAPGSEHAAQDDDLPYRREGSNEPEDAQNSTPQPWLGPSTILGRRKTALRANSESQLLDHSNSEAHDAMQETRSLSSIVNAIVDKEQLLNPHSDRDLGSYTGEPIHPETIDLTSEGSERSPYYDDSELDTKLRSFQDDIECIANSQEETHRFQDSKIQELERRVTALEQHKQELTSKNQELETNVRIRKRTSNYGQETCIVRQ